MTRVENYSKALDHVEGSLEKNSANNGDIDDEPDEDRVVPEVDGCLYRCGKRVPVTDLPGAAARAVLVLIGPRERANVGLRRYDRIACVELLLSASTGLSLSDSDVYITEIYVETDDNDVVPERVLRQFWNRARPWYSQV